jgi:Domain of unknown function (DUF4157)
VRVRQRLAAPAATPVRARPTSAPNRLTTSRRLPPAAAALVSSGYGNRDVQRIVQTQLRVGPAGDQHEREADRVAAEITGGPSGPAPVRAHGPRTEGGVVGPDLRRDIQHARGRGRSIPEHVRAPVERALGADLAHVRLHTDNEADRLSRSLRAQAFSTGRDIFLRRGQADLASRTGRELIAHELTHAARQSGSGGAEGGVIWRKLWQVNPDRVYDDVLNITATRSTGYPHIFIGDTDGNNYEIGADSSGNPTLVAATPGFAVTGAPSGWTLAGTQGFTPPPPWNPAPVAPYWQSPGGSTTYSHSPGGTAYQPGAKGQGKYGQDTRREAAGFVNPRQFAVSMLPLWEAAVRPAGSMPTGMTNKQKTTWFKDPTRQYEVTSGLGGATTMITDYRQAGSTKSAVVLGHSTAASELFNLGGHGHPPGHTVPRPTNYGFNQTTAPYHGLEDYIWSAKSAQYDPAYESPRPDRGSHRTYWDPNEPKYTGGPWHSYNKADPLTMINYIDGKLAGVPTAQRDADHQRAMIELALLKKAFTYPHADQLLSVISAKGW